MPQLDHIALNAKKPEAAARFLAELLNLGPLRTEGADDDMFAIGLDGGVSLLYSVAETVPSQHMAFKVTPAELDQVIEKLLARGIAYGNDPESPANGERRDFLGGYGRVYFFDPEGHLFEVLSY